ncbi:tetratricopeptide repeat protein [Novosphingobium sp. BW1]|uniref:tetratricopeptide repeat protein n=1 Tax=Novosphingobium sp. BW1 TaxID=2592621 RepID=UPI0011DE615E|nr:tetratricopeptide repeat protein [Novosphingobium sp. BW1]TYC90783.1 tetratricopeptide repeat protein [Novosphingobium sp. BW1]
MSRSLARFALPFVVLSLLVACGDSPETLLGKAQDSLAREDFDQARVEVASALQEDPGNSAMLEVLARAYLGLGDPDGAEGALRRLEQVGGGAGLSVLKAEIALLRGRPAEALERLGAAQGEDAARVRAEANLALDRREAAIAAFEAGMEQGSGIRLAEAYARFRLQEGQFDAAEVIRHRMAARDAGAYETLVLAGDLAAARGQTEAAITAFRKVVDAYPDRAPPRVALANQYDIAGDVGAAMKVIESARKHLGATPEIEAMRIQLLSEKGEWETIRTTLQAREAQLEPGSPLSLSYGEALLRLGHAEQARVIFQRASLALPGNPYSKLMLGIAQIETGNPGDAWETLRPLAMSPLAGPQAINAARQAADAVGAPEAAALAARLEPARLKAAQARIEDGARAMARQEWARAVAIYQPMLSGTGDAEVLRRLALAHMHLGQVESAVGYADRAMAQAPDNPDCIYVAGLVRLEGGTQLEKARELLRSAAKADPGNTAVSRSLAKAKAAES